MPPPTNASPDLPNSGTMIAYRFIPGLKEPQRQIVPVPIPGPDEVLIKVLAAGLCHSDIHILDESDTTPLAPHPFTLGHEGAGVISRLGDAVASNPASAQRLAVGTYVAVLLTNACDTPKCARCGSGLENVCFSRHLLGLGADGSWAEYVVARAYTVVPVPGNNPRHPRLTPAVVAVATDAVLTPWHALKKVGRVRPGQTVLVIGCGGLGSNAIQIAKHALGAAVVVATDIREDSLALARKIGADYAVPPAELKTLRDAKGLTIDVVVDVVGIQASMDGAAELAKPGGTVVLIGQGQKSVAISPATMAMKQLTVKGTFVGDYKDLEECLHAIGEGQVVPEVETRAMSDCVQALKELAAGKVRARVALLPR